MKTCSFSILPMCIAAVLLSGCTTPAPRETWFSMKLPPIAPGQGRIVFYRGGDADYWEVVALDGKTAGNLLGLSFFYVDAAPGNYSVGAYPKGPISAAVNGGHETSLALNAGETKYVHLIQQHTAMGAVLLGMGADARPFPVTEDYDTAMKTLPRCVYNEGKYHVF